MSDLMSISFGILSAWPLILFLFLTKYPRVSHLIGEMDTNIVELAEPSNVSGADALVQD